MVKIVTKMFSLHENLACVNFTMEKVQRSLSDIVYYKLQKDCLRIDVWADINVKILGYDFSKTLSAFIELDPCSFILQIGFEKYMWTKVLLNYDWGKLFLDKLINLKVVLKIYINHYALKNMDKFL